MEAREFRRRVPWWLPSAVILGPYCLATGHIVGGQDRLISFGVALVGAVLLANVLLWLAYSLAAVTAATEKQGVSISLGTPRAVWGVTIAAIIGVLFFKLTT